MKKIIIFEGLPASGKTTITNILRDNLGFLKVNESQGKFDPLSPLKSQRAVFEDTLKKYSLAKQTFNKNIIIDRGYPSILNWDYCAQKLGRAWDLKEKKKWTREAIGKGLIFEPDLYVYIDIDPQASLLRRPREEIKVDVWSGPEGMKYSRRHYKKFFFWQSLKHKNVLYLNSFLTPEEAIKIIIKKLNLCN